MQGISVVLLRADLVQRIGNLYQTIKTEGVLEVSLKAEVDPRKDLLRAFIKKVDSLKASLKAGVVQKRRKMLVVTKIKDILEVVQESKGDHVVVLKIV